MLKGFQDFVLRGIVVDLGVAVVIGAAFAAVVSSVVKNFITPLIALTGGFADFSAIRTGPFLWGNILNDVPDHGRDRVFRGRRAYGPLARADEAARADAAIDQKMPGVPERYSRRGPALCTLHCAAVIIDCQKMALHGREYQLG